MKHVIIAAALMPLAACATTGDGLARTDVEETYASAKAPRELALCASARMRGTPRIREGENGAVWIARNNGYGIPMVRWDFIPDGNGGSRVERRASISVNTGDRDVRDCL